MTASATCSIEYEHFVAHQIIFAEVNTTCDTIQQQFPKVIDLPNIGPSLCPICIVSKSMNAYVGKARLVRQPFSGPKCGKIIAVTPCSAGAAWKPVHEMNSMRGSSGSFWTCNPNGPRISSGDSRATLRGSPPRPVIRLTKPLESELDCWVAISQ